MTEPAPTEPCPNCGAGVPRHAGYLPWCDACGWNVAPRTPDAARTMAGAMVEALGGRVERGLADEVAGGGSDVLWRLALTCYAVVIHLLVLACLLLGVWLIVHNFPNIFSFLFAAPLLGVAWLGRPRIAPVPERVLERERYPELYALADRVAAALGARPAAGLTLGLEMNAWIPRAGWRQRPYLHLGLPLFATLTPDERAAVVGHELAHERHGDTALRSALVASAATTLAEIYWLISPEEPHLIAGGPRSAQARHSAANAVAYAFMAVVAFIVRPFATAFVWLTQRRSRRAEYLADQAAAEVGGTAAARTTLVKLHAGNVHSVAAEAAAGDGDVFARLRARVAAAPGREWQRVERVMQHEDTRLDISHPPSAQRVAMLDRMPPHDGAGVLTPEQSAKIDAELALAERSAANLMIEAHRARLYR